MLSLKECLKQCNPEYSSLYRPGSYAAQQPIRGPLNTTAVTYRVMLVNACHEQIRELCEVVPTGGIAWQFAKREQERERILCGTFAFDAVTRSCSCYYR